MNPNTQLPQEDPVVNNPNTLDVQPEIQVQPSMQPEIVPVLPAPQPEVQPQMQPVAVQPQTVQPEIIAPVEQSIPQPVQPAQFVQPQTQVQPQQPQAQQFQSVPQAGFGQAMVAEKSGLLGLVEQKAGIISLALYGVAIVTLSLATIIYLNNILSDIKAMYVTYGSSTDQIPTLFETTKNAIFNWVFVNGLSAWWWVLSFIPALSLAGYSLYKTKLKNIFAIITVVLVFEVYLNLIIK